VEKSSPKIVFVYFQKKLPEEKSRPKGENSTNLVTLLDVVKRDSEKIVGRM
jgi:hypothetical protein